VLRGCGEVVPLIGSKPTKRYQRLDRAVFILGPVLWVLEVDDQNPVAMNAAA
jgi:hypothetical protein